jgi:ribosomal protein S18 acetylase RimI-like enzyme
MLLFVVIYSHARWIIPMTIVIKNAAIDDAKEIATIHVQSWKTAYAGIMPAIILNSLSIENYQHAWHERLTQGCKVLIATELDQIHGFVSYCPSRDEDADPVKTAEISAIYLAPEQFRKGLGTRLCEAAEAAVSESGFEELTLWVLDANRPARMFYERLGFTATGDAVADNFNKVELKEILYKKIVTKKITGK